MSVDTDVNSFCLFNLSSFFAIVRYSRFEYLFISKSVSCRITLVYISKCAEQFTHFFHNIFIT